MKMTTNPKKGPIRGPLYGLVYSQTPRKGPIRGLLYGLVYSHDGGQRPLVNHPNRPHERREADPERDRKDERKVVRRHLRWRWRGCAMAMVA